MRAYGLHTTISNCSNNYGPLPARGEVHPAPDNQHHRRRAPQALRHRRERPRLDLHRGPLERGLGHPHQGPRGRDPPHRRRRGAKQHRGPAHGPRDDGQVVRRFRLGARPPRPRPPLRHRLDQAANVTRLAPGAQRLQRGPAKDHRVVQSQRILVAPNQGGHRGALQGSGTASELWPRIFPATAVSWCYPSFAIDLTSASVAYYLAVMSSFLECVGMRADAGLSDDGGTATSCLCRPRTGRRPCRNEAPA